MSDGTGKQNRRDFLRTVAAGGAGLALSSIAGAQTTARPAVGKVDDLHVAMIGPGSQGRNLLTKCLRIPGIRFTAVCDIWPYHQRYAANILKKWKQPVNVYADYQDLLASEKDLHAVIVATPDWVHAPMTIAALEHGCHVYCEKEMSNDLDQARAMVRAAKKTGNLLQIGHQRRSNPRYHLAEKLIHKDKFCGRITNVSGQWHRSRLLDLGWPKGRELDAEALEKYGYGTMQRFRNWRCYRKYSGGWMADLGSHQVDVYNWFLRTPPKAVLASGGIDYYKDGREWYDNVMAVYEYDTEFGPVRAAYEVLNTTGVGGFFEQFMGDKGTVVVSEDSRKGFLYREPMAERAKWEDEAAKVETMGQEAIQLKVGESLTPEGRKDPKAQTRLAQVRKPVHQLHLENFFDAIRHGTPLTCPPEVAFETCVSVLRANDAVAAGLSLTLDPDEFKA